MRSLSNPAESAASPPSRLALALIALPALAAGFAILESAGLGTPIRSLHAASIALAAVIAVIGAVVGRFARGRRSAFAIVALALIGLAATLAEPASGPQRWVSFGFLGLYMAPLLLPALLVAIAALSRDGVGPPAAFAAIVASLLLALQPDASQLLALCAALATLVILRRARGAWAWAAITVPALAMVWAFLRPDPLEPVAHVEGVFALAFAHSLPAGLAVAAAALAFLAGLALLARRGPRWLLAVAVYYAALYACSLAGMTPAPLIGYGAGPVLGYGLLIAVCATGATLPARTASAPRVPPGSS
jgi:cell division protein FtsW (lipid II flippase)